MSETVWKFFLSARKECLRQNLIYSHNYELIFSTIYIFLTKILEYSCWLFIWQLFFHLIVNDTLKQQTTALNGLHAIICLLLFLLLFFCFFFFHQRKKCFTKNGIYSYIHRCFTPLTTWTPIDMFIIHIYFDEAFFSLMKKKTTTTTKTATPFQSTQKKRENVDFLVGKCQKNAWIKPPFQIFRTCFLKRWTPYVSQWSTRKIMK